MKEKTQQPDLKEILGNLVGTVAHQEFPRGDRAALRRMNAGKLGAPRPSVYWRLLLQQGVEPQNERQARAWEAILQGIALTAEHCHGTKDSLGAALGAQGNLMEDRFFRCLESQGERFYDQLRQILRMAASKGWQFQWNEVAQLCLSSDEAHRRRICEQLAQNFFIAQWKKDNPQTSSVENESVDQS